MLWKFSHLGTFKTTRICIDLILIVFLWSNPLFQSWQNCNLVYANLSMHRHTSIDYWRMPPLAWRKFLWSGKQSQPWGGSCLLGDSIWFCVIEVHIFTPLERWVAKLIARLLATVALRFRIQKSLKNTKWATVYRYEVYKWLPQNL